MSINLNKTLDPEFSECTALVLCPKCKGICKEVWHSHTKSGTARKSIKRVGVFCKECNFDLSTIKQPEQ